MNLTGIFRGEEGFKLKHPLQGEYEYITYSYCEERSLPVKTTIKLRIVLDISLVLKKLMHSLKLFKKHKL